MKKRQKYTKNRCKFTVGKRQAKNVLKTWVLGGSWLPFGRGFGRRFEPLGDSGPFFWHFFSCLYLEWSSKVLLEASGLDLGSISRGLGRILGGFWMDFERKFGGIWQILGYSGHFEPLKCF